MNPDHGSSYFSSHGNQVLEEYRRGTEAFLFSQFLASLIFSSIILYILGIFHIWASALLDFLVRFNAVTDKTQWTLGDGQLEASDSAPTNIEAPISLARLRLCECIFVFMKIWMALTADVLLNLW